MLDFKPGYTLIYPDGTNSVIQCQTLDWVIGNEIFVDSAFLKVV